MSSEVQEQSANYNLADLKPVLENTSDKNMLLDSLPIWLSAQTAKSAGRGRSADNTHQYGVQKLRELILELAVRGKLVEQNPNDEPASILLEKVANERTRLVKERKAKAVKNLPALDEQTKPFDIPSSWGWAYLADLGQIIGGGTPKSGTAEYWADNDVKWLTPADLYGFGDKYIYSGKRDISQKGLENSSACLMPVGTVLFSSRAPIGYVAIAGTALATNQGFKSCSPYIEGLSEYLYFFLKRTAKEIDEAASGTTFKEISGAGMAKVIVSVPPLAEQHRIAKKVDELMALCDKLEQQQADAVQAHDTLVNVLLDTLTQSDNADDYQQNWHRIAEHFDILFTTESSIDQLKQTLLQLAVMGKLVPQAPNDEPASVLLEKIAEEKARLVKEGKIKKQKTKHVEPSDHVLHSLPRGWAVTEFESVIDPQFSISYGVLVPGPEVKDGVPFVRVGDLTLNNSNHLPEKTISEEVDKKFAKTRLHGGEILMCVVGSIGKLGIAPDSWKGANIARAICRLVPSKLVSKKYILMLLQSPYMQERFGVDTRTLAQPTLNVGLVRLASTPIPPLAEQHRIVKKVDELMALCDQLKERLNQAQTLQQQLADAVVGTMI